MVQRIMPPPEDKGAAKRLETKEGGREEEKSRFEISAGRNAPERLRGTKTGKAFDAAQRV